MKTYLTITLFAATFLSLPESSFADHQNSETLPVVNGSTAPGKSTVGGKIEIPLTTFSKLLNQSGTKTFRKTSGVERYNVRLQKFSVSSTGRGLVLKSPISGSGSIYKEKKKGLKAHVNFDIKYGSVTVYAVPEITPDFKIRTNISSVKMDAQITWRTKLFKGNRGIQQNFAKAEVAKMARDLDRQLSAKLNLRGEVAKIWAQTHGVAPIPSNPPTFLVTHPTGIRCGKPDFRDRRKIQFALRLDCNSAVDLEQPEVTGVKSMPQMQIRRGLSTATTFRVPMIVPLSDLESIVKGEIFEVPFGEQRTFSISNVRLRSESQNQWVLDGDLKLSGDSASTDPGSVSMRAFPKFSSANQQLRFTDLTFSDTTKSQLLDGGLESMANSEVEKAIENEMTIDLSSQVKPVAEQVGQLSFLNSRIDSQKIKVDRIKLARVTDYDAAIIDLVFNLPGHIKLTF